MEENINPESNLTKIVGTGVKEQEGRNENPWKRRLKRARWIPLELGIMLTGAYVGADIGYRISSINWQWFCPPLSCLDQHVMRELYIHAGWGLGTLISAAGIFVAENYKSLANKGLNFVEKVNEVYARMEDYGKQMDI